MRPEGAVSLPCSRSGAAIRSRRPVAAGRKAGTRTIPTSVFVPGGWENDIRARAIQWEREVAATPARRWFGGRGESQRAEGQAAKDAAAADAHDLDGDGRDAAAAGRARAELTRARDELRRTKADLDRFGEGLGSLLQQAETQLARLAPAVERARQALLAATNALDEVRGS